MHMVGKKQIAKNVKASALTTTTTSLLNLIQLVVVARLLEPVDFGLMNMVTVLTGFLLIFIDFGVGEALIQKQNSNPNVLSSLYWFNIFVGVLLFLFTIAITPAVVSYYNEPKLYYLLQFISLNFIIISLGRQFQFLLEKDLNFNILSKIEISAAIIGFLVTLTGALLGIGVYALATGIITQNLTKSLYYYAHGKKTWKPGLYFKLSEITGHLKYGITLCGQRVVNYTTGNIDYFVIGSLFGARELGFYTIAYNLIGFASSKVNAIFSRVFFPVLTKYKDDQSKLRHGYLRLQETTSFINLPILIGLAAVSELAIPLLFGTQWKDSVILLQILTLVGITRSISGTVGPLILASGNVGHGFRWSILVLCIQAPSLLIGAMLGGVVGVAIAFAITSSVFAVLNYTLLVRKMIGPCLTDYFNTMRLPLMFSFAMGVGVYSIIYLGESHINIGALYLLIFATVAGSTSYLALNWFFNRTLLHESLHLLRSKS